MINRPSLSPVRANRSGGLMALLSLLPLAGSADDAAAPASPAEQEIVLAAADLVQPSLLNGPGYRVQARAEMRGLQARFWIDSDWGGFPVDSVDLLAQRIDEMPAVQALHAQPISDLLKQTGIDALIDPARAIGTLASDPIGAASRAPSGLLCYFGDRVRRLGERAEKLGNRIDRAVFHEGSPGDDSAGDGKPRAAAPWWRSPANELGRLLRSEAGHGKARRALAASFGIDPWTSNPLLKARLDQLAWAVAGGRLASTQLITLASAGGARAIAQVEQVATLTAEPAPRDLRRQAVKRMEHWSADGDLIYALAWRGAFPPPRLHRLLDQIDALAARRGVEALLETASLAESEIEARFVFNALDMLLANAGNPVQGGELLPAGALIAYRSADGEFLLPLPVDRLSWTPEVRDWFDDQRISDHPRRTVLVGGTISRQAELALTRRGWSLRSHYQWPQAPPYRAAGSTS